MAGGVASNQYIRGELAGLASSQDLGLFLPPPKWCTDNGVMIAWAGIERCADLDVEQHIRIAVSSRMNEPYRSRLKLGLMEPPPAWASGSHQGSQSKSNGAAQLLQQLHEDRLDSASRPNAEEEGERLNNDGEEWIELRPRWPLTTVRHPNSMPNDKLRSAKKARMSESLTEMTEAALRLRQETISAGLPVIKIN